MRLGIASIIIAVAAIAHGEPAHVDNAALAERLVKQAANIHAGDLVYITGGVRDLELLEDILTSVRKAGANGMISIESDRLTKKRYDEMPARYDADSTAFDLKLMEFVTAQISIDSRDDPALESSEPPDRVAAQFKAWEPVLALTRKRNVRVVGLGNGLNPTAKQAEAFGIPLADLTKAFWDGVNVDYDKLQATGDAVKTRLAAGESIELTNPNGTKLKLRVGGRSVSVSDGVISDEDIKTGGAAVQAWLPAGEVYLTPVPGTAEGRIVIDHQMFMGKDIRGLQLTFKAGKLVSMTAKEGLPPLEASYRAGGVGKDLFAFIDVGINPNVKLPAQGKLQSYIPAGMVTIGVGNNLWAGGDNNVNFTLVSFLPGSTLKVDGKPLVDKGALKP